VLAASANARRLSATLPEAVERIAAAVDYLRSKSIAKIAIVSHSMGASMANAFLARTAIDAWAPIGMFGPFAAPPREPVLGHRSPETEIAPVRETGAGPGFDAAEGCVLAAAHDRRGRSLFREPQKELVAAIAAFLDRAFAGAAQPASGAAKRTAAPGGATRSIAIVVDAARRARQRSRTASHASSSGTFSIRMTSAFAASSVRRFA
jgi:hypothetical protein